MAIAKSNFQVSWYESGREAYGDNLKSFHLVPLSVEAALVNISGF